jgi:hypothetical protein
MCESTCRYWSGVSPTLEPHKAVPVIPEPTPGVLEIDPAILWNPQTLIGADIHCITLSSPGRMSMFVILLA